MSLVSWAFLKTFADSQSDGFIEIPIESSPSQIARGLTRNYCETKRHAIMRNPNNMLMEEAVGAPRGYVVFLNTHVF